MVDKLETTVPSDRVHGKNPFASNPFKEKKETGKYPLWAQSFAVQQRFPDNTFVLNVAGTDKGAERELFDDTLVERVYAEVPGRYGPNLLAYTCIQDIGNGHFRVDYYFNSSGDHDGQTEWNMGQEVTLQALLTSDNFLTPIPSGPAPLDWQHSA